MKTADARIPFAAALRAIPAAVLGAAMLLVAELGFAADAPDPAAAYRVADVAADDALNVRAHAGTQAPVVGRLASGSRGIVATGAVESVGSGIWWQIVHPEAERGRGWVNARFLSRQDDSAAHDFALACAGTEPFWSLRVDEGTARFATPGDDIKQPAWRAGRRIDAQGMQSGQRFAVRLEADGPAGATSSGWLSVWRRAQAPYCSDNMSDIGYPYAAILVAPSGRVLAGCCARDR